MRFRGVEVAAMLVLLTLIQCRPSGPKPGSADNLANQGTSIREESSSVAFVVYDAGETLALLPVARRLRAEGTQVRWIPLTPWAGDLLLDHGEAFLALPGNASELTHVEDRNALSETGYWEKALARDPPSLAVLGMVAVAQGQIASRLGEAGVSATGYYDGFQPPDQRAIGARVAPDFQEIWVSTARVRRGFESLGFQAVVVGQPTLETWRRASEQVDPEEVRGLQGLRESDRIIVFAGQYGAGYAEALTSFLEAMRRPLSGDSSLNLILSHHPRVDGSLERSALDTAHLPRAMMAAEGLLTSKLATIADAVITWTSTVAVQAAFMGKPVVYFSPPADFDTHLVESGGAELADETNLDRILAEVLREPGNADARRAALEEAGFVVDADVVVAEMILAALGRGG